MDHQGFIIRPPSEADSILLQVTTGCSHNKCAFCGAYQGKRFSIKPQDRIFRDIDFARAHCQRQRRLFLMDGDALIMPMKRLIPILERIRERLPWVTRVATYANAKSVARKNDQELAGLKELGLDLAYMGLESGDDATLRGVNKHGDSTFIIEQALRLKQAGMKLNITVLLGLAGEERSQDHARLTGEALSRMDPEQAAALALMLIPGTPLHRAWEQGEFILPGPNGMLKELRTMLEHTHLSRGLFLANHASNYLPLKLRLPRDKDKALALIDSALAGKTELKPEALRRL